jgi:predicted acetyltransferase
MTVTSILTAPLRDDELTLELASFQPHPTHKVPTYYFRMVHRDSKEDLGRINLRVASTPHIELYAGHIGYGVHPASRGHRYAARATRLLIPLARELHLNPLWITTDPDNIASRRSCELAGAEFVEIVDVPATCIINRDGHPKKCRYRLQVVGSN